MKFDIYNHNKHKRVLALATSVQCFTYLAEQVFNHDPISHLEIRTSHTQEKIDEHELLNTGLRQSLDDIRKTIKSQSQDNIAINTYVKTVFGTFTQVSLEDIPYLSNKPFRLVTLKLQYVTFNFIA